MVEAGVSKLFTMVENDFDKHHVENKFVDFHFERNIPLMLSQEGPKAAVADVNGDGFGRYFYRSGSWAGWTACTSIMEAVLRK